MAAESIEITVGPYKGRYPFDMDEALTSREWWWIETISGLNPDTIEEVNRNPRGLCAFAAIAMYRAGRIGKQDVVEAADELLDLKYDGEAISLSGFAQENDERPPALTPQPAEQSENSDNSNETDSGAHSTNGSDGSAVAPSPIGTTR